MNHNIEIVKEKLPFEERLCQLAEECNELAKAALKLRRTCDMKNPTPVSSADAFENLVEEMADVLLCFKVLEMETNNERIIEIQERKAKRWVERLNSKVTVRGYDVNAESD